MRLPDSKTLLGALTKIRGEDHPPPHRLSRKMVYAKWNEIRKRNGLKELGDDTFTQLIVGKRSLKYDEVNDLLEAHGVTCFDLFLDDCTHATKDSVKFIRKTDRHPIIRGDCRLYSVDPQFLGSNRTKVDWIELPPGKSTEWAHHSGHEFVLVGVGTVRAEFNREGGLISEELTEYDGVSFPSMLSHRFVNQSDVRAVLVAARPVAAKVTELDH